MSCNLEQPLVKLVPPWLKIAMCKLSLTNFHKLANASNCELLLMHCTSAWLSHPSLTYSVLWHNILVSHYQLQVMHNFTIKSFFFSKYIIVQYV